MTSVGRQARSPEACGDEPMVCIPGVARFMLNFVGIILSVAVAGFLALLPFFLLLWGTERILQWIPFGRPMRFLLVMVKSLRRNRIRTSLTYLATFVLVVVVTLVWSTLYFL